MASEDQDEAPANIRSRIAVFEGISGPAVAKSQQEQPQRKASDPPKLPAKPVLPPRKAGSGSSVLSQSDAISPTSNAATSIDNASVPTGIARPPPPKPTVTRSPAQSVSLSSPPPLATASASSLPSAALSSFPKPTSRSSTLSSTSSTATATSVPDLPPRPRASSSTPAATTPTPTVVSPRASPAPPANRRMLPPEVRPASPGNIGSRSAILPATSAPPKRNGSATEPHPLAYKEQPFLAARPISASQGNIVAVPKRYLDLWERLVQAVKPASSVEEARIEGIYIREIWMRSKLKDNILARIWLQCDPQKTGSLNRQGFVKGMGLIDDALRQNSQRRRLQR